MLTVVWIGTFAAAWWFFNLTLREAQGLYFNLSKNGLQWRDPRNIFELFKVQLPSSILGMGQASQLYDTLFIADLRLLSRREVLLRLALAPLSWIFVYLSFLFVLQINGWLLIGVASLFAFVTRRVSTLFSSANFRSLISLVLSLGIFLISFESLLRQQSLLLNIESDLSLVFFLSDSRSSTILSIFLISIVASLLLRLRNASVIWALFLLISQVSPLLGVVAWLLGERFADGILWAWRSRQWTFMKHEIRGYAVVWCFSWFLSLGFFLIFKERIPWFEGDFATSIQVRIFELIILLIFCHVFATCSLMAWGHWAALQKKEFEVTPFTGDSSWIDREFLHPTLVLQLQSLIEEKIIRLTNQRANFNDKEWSSVPRPFQTQWELELKNLQEWVKKSKSILSSRITGSSVLH